MLDLVVFVIVVGTSIWAGIDSYTNKVPQLGQKEFGKHDPWIWAICCLLLWIIVLPAYLIKRAVYAARTEVCHSTECTTAAGSVEELLTLKQLLDNGAVTQDEYAVAKARLIAGQNRQTRVQQERAVNPLVVVVPVLLVVALFAAMAIPNFQRARAEREHKFELASDAISSLRAIGSALAVGIIEAEYNKKVIDAQTKIDTFASECGEAEFNGLAAELRYALEPYTDAGRVWNKEIRNGSFLGAYSPLNDELLGRYPRLQKAKSQYGLHCDTARQVLWEIAISRSQSLKLPAKDE